MEFSENEVKIMQIELARAKLARNKCILLEWLVDGAHSDELRLAIEGVINADGGGIFPAHDNLMDALVDSANITEGAALDSLYQEAGTWKRYGDGEDCRFIPNRTDI